MTVSNLTRADEDISGAYLEDKDALDFIEIFNEKP